MNWPDVFYVGKFWITNVICLPDTKLLISFIFFLCVFVNFRELHFIQIFEFIGSFFISLSISPSIFRIYTTSLFFKSSIGNLYFLFSWLVLLEAYQLDWSFEKNNFQAFNFSLFLLHCFSVLCSLFPFFKLLWF